MAIRLLDVSAYTTLDYVTGRVFGSDWSDDAAAVVDVDRPKAAPGSVRLQLEFDGEDVANIAHHADSISLSPDQARALAADLERQAANAEAEKDVPGGRGR
jgi:hypothetical protein